LHWRVVVIQHHHLIHARRLGLGGLPLHDDSPLPVVRPRLRGGQRGWLGLVDWHEIILSTWGAPCAASDASDPIRTSAYCAHAREYQAPICGGPTTLSRAHLGWCADGPACP